MFNSITIKGENIEYIIRMIGSGYSKLPFFISLTASDTSFRVIRSSEIGMVMFDST